MRSFLKLVVCMVSLYLIVVLIIPAINRMPFFRPIQQVIKKWDINSSAFFYTDSISSSPEVTKHTDL